MNADGSGQTWLTNANLATPSWSPDGSRVAFTWDSDGIGLGASVEIYTLRLVDSQLTQLTNNPVLDTEPLWSADSAQIFFLSDRDSNPEIYLMNADGSSQTRVTVDAANECCMAWSPDGLLAFASNRDGNYEVYRINPNGSGLVRLTDNLAYDAPFGWRP
jgi:TolB protein